MTGGWGVRTDLSKIRHFSFFSWGPEGSKSRGFLGQGSRVPEGSKSRGFLGQGSRVPEGSKSRGFLGQGSRVPENEKKKILVIKKKSHVCYISKYGYEKNHGYEKKSLIYLKIWL